MNLLEVKAAVDALCAVAGEEASSMLFGVKVFTPGGLRMVPLVEVRRIARDIDLGSGNVYVELVDEVSKVSADERDAIMTSVRRGGSWHAYQAHKRSAEKIEVLERRISQLTAALAVAGVLLPPEEASSAMIETKP